MSGLHGSSGLCVFLLLPLLAYSQAAVAATPEQNSSAANAPSQRAAAESPEEEGDRFMGHHWYEAALRAYQRETNRSAVLWNKMGTAYHHMYAFEEAGKCYERALAIDPHFASALNNLAAVYYSRRDLGQAERFYQQALQYEPKSAVTLKNLGLTYFADDKYKLDTEAYRKALALNPDILRPNPLITVDEGGTARQAVNSDYYLARICAAAGQMHDAITYLREALEHGFHDRKHLMKDKQFAALRATPEFQQLIAENIGGK